MRAIGMHGLTQLYINEPENTQWVILEFVLNMTAYELGGREYWLGAGLKCYH